MSPAPKHRCALSSSFLAVPLLPYHSFASPAVTKAQMGKISTQERWGLFGLKFQVIIHHSGISIALCITFIVKSREKQMCTSLIASLMTAHLDFS